MQERPLLPHPDTPADVVQYLVADAVREGPTSLLLYFTLVGHRGMVRIPQEERSGRSHELWLHTCFEAFVRTGESAYREINLSPTGEWAAYAFTDYREGMRVDEYVTVTVLDQAVSTSGGFGMSARVDGLPPGDWQVGLSTIVETTQGERLFFALTHPPGAPDFHHGDAFSLDLPA